MRLLNFLQGDSMISPEFQQFFERPFFGNPVSSYLIALGIVVIGSLVVFLVQKAGIRILQRAAKKTASDLDDKIVAVIEARVIPLLYLGVLWLGMQNLTLDAAGSKITLRIGTVLATFFSVRIVLALLYIILDRSFHKKNATGERKKVLDGIFSGLQVIVWGIAVVLMLDNLGVKISTLVAGLGIGGVAVALASQALLADLFSYFAISFDRPFEIGDFIITGDFMGTVENIGVKTTRIQSLSGEQIVFCNSDLLNSRVRNYRRMQRRRVQFAVGITYDTPVDKVKEIPVMIKTIIDQTSDTAFDRAHLKEFGNFSLNFEIVYYVANSDYNKYMDIHQSINFRIMEAFERERIDFAFPTQTLHLIGDNGTGMSAPDSR